MTRMRRPGNSALYVFLTILFAVSMGYHIPGNFRIASICSSCVRRNTSEFRSSWRYLATTILSVEPEAETAGVLEGDALVGFAGPASGRMCVDLFPWFYAWRARGSIYRRCPVAKRKRSQRLD